MKAWVIDKISDLNKEDKPLKLVEMPMPEPKDREVLIKISVCGICHTEIDEIEGRTPPPEFPVIPGHQVVGEIVQTKGRRSDLKIGDRVGVAWVFSSCGDCEYCVSGNENLCNDFKATGRDANGGYAEFMVVPEKFTYKIPSVFSDEEAAPLLCAGAVGYRSVLLAKLKEKARIGLTGFGASAHLVLQLLKFKYPDSKIYVFARNSEERRFALDLGADWAGDTTEKPPESMHGVIDTTPVWKPVLYAMEYLNPGGRLVINAIRKENIDTNELLKLDYGRHLWMEKEMKSVANVTGKDVVDFLQIASKIPLKPDVQIYPFEEANEALMEIKQSKIRGAKVLKIGG